MKKRILLYITRRDDLDFVYPLVANNQTIEYGIIVQSMLHDEFLRTPSGRLPNIQFVDWKTLDSVSISQYGLFISTDTKGIGGDNLLLFSLSQIFNSINVPIIELQSCLLPERDRISIFTHCLSWCDMGLANATCIGYPPSAFPFERMQGEYLLVLTDFDNLHYSDKDVSVFSHAIFEYARLHATASIIWKFVSKTSERTLNAIKHFKHFYEKESDRIFFCGAGGLLDRLSISELICKSRLVITTATMPRLLDCELYGTPVAVYIDEKATWKQLQLGDMTTFQDAKGLENAIFDTPCKLLHAGFLKLYDNLAYLRFIETFYMKTPPTDKSAYINALVLVSDFFRGDKVKEGEDSNGQSADVDIERLRSKHKWHLKVIRKMLIGLITLLLIIIALLCVLFFE